MKLKERKADVIPHHGAGVGCACLTVLVMRGAEGHVSSYPAVEGKGTLWPLEYSSEEEARNDSVGIFSSPAILSSVSISRNSLKT